MMGRLIIEKAKQSPYKKKCALRVCSMVAHLPNMCKVQGSILSIKKWIKEKRSIGGANTRANREYKQIVSVLIPSKGVKLFFKVNASPVFI